MGTRGQVTALSPGLPHAPLGSPDPAGVLGDGPVQVAVRKWCLPGAGTEGLGEVSMIAMQYWARPQSAGSRRC